MRQKPFLSYAILGLTLLLILSVPPKKMHRLRASLVAKTLKLETLIRKESKWEKLERKYLSLKEENSSLKHQLSNLHLPLQSLSEQNIARVIFRDPAFWASSVLIDKGMQDSAIALEKNSPVLSGGNLIGLVEEVFETFSKVRLITDKNLQFSVRKQQANGINDGLEVGTLCGIASIDNRYRFGHVEGQFFAPTLKPGDQLVTSGLDGIFPEGLPVAIVTEVTIAQEEVTFPFKAIVTAPDMKDLRVVTILKANNSYR